MAKLALVEFDVGQDWTRYVTGTWVNYGPGIYYTDFTGTYSSITSAWVEGAETLTVTSVGTVYAFENGSTYSLVQVASIAALNTEPSFYWDEANDYLYVRLPDFNPPDIYTIVLGISAYVAQRHWINETGSSQYDGDLRRLPRISKKIGAQFWGKISYDKATIELDNNHGQYDSFADYDVYGQGIRILYGNTEDSYSDLTTVWTGYIDDFSIAEDRILISASDPRRKLEEPIPPAVFDSTTYTNIDDNDENKPIPLAYGEIRNVTPICQNKGEYEKASADSFTFKLCDMDDHDAIYAITDVRYNGESLAGTTGADDLYWNTGADSLTAATVQIDKLADVELDFKKITVDFSGYEDSGGDLISGGLDVIRDLIETYADTAYVNSNFDITQWDSLGSYDRSVGVYVEKSTSIIKVIEEIINSIQMQFDVTGDGRYTVRRYNSGIAPAYTIEEYEIMNYPLSLDYDSDEFLSSVIVNYANGKTYVYDTEEDDINQRFKFKRAKEFDTVLTAASDVADYAERVMTFSRELLPLVDIRTKMDTIDIELEDLVLIYINRRKSTWLDLVLCRVESKDVNLDDFTIDFGLRIIEQATIETGHILTTDDDPIITAGGDRLVHYNVG